ncbi:MAG: VOC family protein [Nitrospirae bacterium]|nr:VOC family protein [Nitrospirota bacterium]
MNRSLAFYKDALGLRLFQDEIISGPDLDLAFMEKDVRVRMVLLADEVGNMIELLEWKNPKVKERPAEHMNFISTGLVEVCLAVSDLEKLKDALEREGVSFRTPVWKFSNVVNRHIGPELQITHVVDPDGVQVELIQVLRREPMRQQA